MLWTLTIFFSFSLLFSFTPSKIKIKKAENSSKFRMKKNQIEIDLFSEPWAIDFEGNKVKPFI